MSKHVLNPMQTQLFVDPVEHINTVVGSTDFRTRPEDNTDGTKIIPAHRTPNDMWNEKVKEAKGPQFKHRSGGLYQKMESEGYRGAPIQNLPAHDNSGWVQYEGHHRLAVAADIQKRTGKQQWVPIEYKNMAIGHRFGERSGD